MRARVSVFLGNQGDVDAYASQRRANGVWAKFGASGTLFSSANWCHGKLRLRVKCHPESGNEYTRNGVSVACIIVVYWVLNETASSHHH